MEEKVLSELNMTLEILEDGVQHLIQWISKQPHLPDVTDEQLLRSFIIGSKSVERAKGRLEKYYSARTKYPIIFGDRDPNTIEWHKALRMGSLEELTPDNFNVVASRIPQPDEINDFMMADVLKVWFMVLDEQLRNRPFTSGLVVLVDCSNFSFKHMLKYSPSLTAAGVNSFQNAYPVRVKYIIFFNAPYLFASFFNHVLKHFFTKLKKRLRVHSEDHTILQQYLPLDILPCDYGGSDMSIDILYEKLQQILKKERNWFISEGSVGSDEAKRLKS